MKTLPDAFHGDAAAHPTEITLNRKGGSVSVIIRKVITNLLPGLLGADKVFGTCIPGQDGNGLIVLSSFVEESDPSVRITRQTENRYEILIGEDTDIELDNISLAFLQLKETEIAEGRATISNPVSASDIRARLLP